MKKLLIVINSEKFLLSHRLEIAREALAQGFSVNVVAPDTGYAKEITDNGFSFTKLHMKRSSFGLLSSIWTTFQLFRVYRHEKPDVIHHVTLKLCILGSLAAKLAGCRNVVNAITGFGYVFSESAPRMIRTLVRFIIQLTLKNGNYRFIVQNPDDLKQLRSYQLTAPENIILIKGSGVNLDVFAQAPAPEGDRFVFLFSSRMLWDKGVMDFIYAARLLKDRLASKALFVMVGNCDSGNKNVISREALEAQMDPDYLEYRGHVSSMIEFFRMANVVVLPSYYREGLPKTLIEACAVGRPILTTDLPGCKETILNDNGFYVRPRDPADLAEKMLLLFNDRELCKAMGNRSRELAEREFDIRKVVEMHLRIYHFFRTEVK